MTENITKLVSIMENYKKARITMKDGAVVVCCPDSTSDDYENLDITIEVLTTTDATNYPTFKDCGYLLDIDDSDIASVEEYTE